MIQYVVSWEHFDRTSHMTICDSLESAKKQMREYLGYAENHYFADSEEIRTIKAHSQVEEIIHIRKCQNVGTEVLRLRKALTKE